MGNSEGCFAVGGGDALATIVGVCTVLGLLVGLVAFVRVVQGEYRTKNLRPYVPNSPISPTQRLLPTVVLWRSRSFLQALSFCDEFIDLLDAECRSGTTGQPDDAGHVRTADAFGMAISLLLVAAARLSPYSQNKANAFCFSDAPCQGEPPTRRIRTFSIYGPFSVRQITAPTGVFRGMSVDPDAYARSAAARALMCGDAVMVRLRGEAYDSEPERGLGTTHVLGISVPLDWAAAQVGELAALTVDIRYPLLYRPFVEWAGNPLFHARVRRIGALQSRFEALRCLLAANMSVLDVPWVPRLEPFVPTEGDEGSRADGDQPDASA